MIAPFSSQTRWLPGKRSLKSFSGTVTVTLVNDTGARISESYDVPTINLNRKSLALLIAIVCSGSAQGEEYYFDPALLQGPLTDKILPVLMNSKRLPETILPTFTLMARW